MLVEELAEAFHRLPKFAGLGSALRPLSRTGLQTRPTEFSLAGRQGWLISILSAEPSSTIGLVLLCSRNYFQHVLCSFFALPAS